MFKLEFDAANKPLAAAIGAALAAYGRGETKPPKAEPYPQPTETDAADEFVAAVSETIEAIDELAGETATHETIEGATSAASPDVDEKGVAKNAQFCGTATDPFYGSGKRKGQWKKLRGVTEEDYDAWYAGALAKVAHGNNTEAEAETVDTSAAFGAPATTAPANEPVTFATVGDYMAWVAEQQTAGLLIQGDIDDAYRSVGVQIQDLFSPAKFQESVAKVYGKLSDIVARAAGA